MVTGGPGESSQVPFRSQAKGEECVGGSMHLFRLFHLI